MSEERSTALHAMPRQAERHLLAAQAQAIIVAGMPEEEVEQ